jgi:GNAT superfamily N-acetyltransferase
MKSASSASKESGILEARISVVRYTCEYYAWACHLLKDRWGSTRVVTRGVVHQADRLPAFVAVLGNEPKGLVTYRCAEGECEIVTLDSLLERRGMGTSLLRAVEGAAKVGMCRRVWLVTTNDNIEALRFYQHRGFAIVAVHHGAIERSRKLKPEIPRIGKHGIPIRDEIELELEL